MQAWAQRGSQSTLPWHGQHTLLIWVNVHNPARRFYEALGGVHARTGSRKIKGVTYDDAGYGWDEAAFARLIGEKMTTG